MIDEEKSKEPTIRDHFEIPCGRVQTVAVHSGGEWGAVGGKAVGAVHLSRPRKSLVWTSAAPIAVNALAWTATSSLTLAAASSATVTLWELGTSNWTALGQLTGHSRAISSVAWQPQGSLLATVAGDGRLLLWDPRTSQTPVHTFTSHTGSQLSH